MFWKHNLTKILIKPRQMWTCLGFWDGDWGLKKEKAMTRTSRFLLFLFPGSRWVIPRRTQLINITKKEEKKKTSPPYLCQRPGCITNLTFIFFSCFRPCLPAEMNCRGRSAEWRRARRSLQEVWTAAPSPSLSATICWEGARVHMLNHRVGRVLQLAARRGRAGMSALICFCRRAQFFLFARLFFFFFWYFLWYRTSDTNTDTEGTLCPSLCVRKTNTENVAAAEKTSGDKTQPRRTTATVFNGDNYTK